jgi:antitoxin component YwqK of YwqJK toxin-antitoxin module
MISKYGFPVYRLSKKAFDGMQRYIELHENGSRSVDGWLIHQRNISLKHGTWREWSETGTLLKEGEYVMDKKQGVWRLWSDEGVLLSEGRYRDGLMEGVWKEWFESGKLAREVFYRLGRIDRYDNSWYENGQKMGECPYKNYQRDGIWKFWYENGNPSRENSYKGDKLDGTCKNWFENGMLRTEETFKDSYQHGPSRFFTETGIMTEEQMYHEAILHGHSRSWDDDGNILYETYYHHGSLEGYDREWFPNGRMKKESFYRNNMLHGKTTCWYENGQMKSTGEGYEELTTVPVYSDTNSQFIMEMEKIFKEGEHLEWYEDGTAKSVVFYERNVEVEGMWWDRNGVLEKIVSKCPFQSEIIQRETKHICLILHDVIPSGDKYMLCSFSEEHVHDYNALQSFFRAARQTEATCQYCSNTMREEIYQQP